MRSDISPDILDLDYQYERTIVLLPSISFSGLTSKYLVGLNFFEERNLFYLACLKNPKSQFIAILSDIIDDNFVNYCIEHVCAAHNLSRSSISDRFSIMRIPVDDNEHLTSALLRQPELVTKLREKLKSHANPIIDFWMVSEDDINLAYALGVPYYGMPRDALHFDNKSNARELLRSINIRIPIGYEHIQTIEGVWRGLQDLQQHSSADSFLIKLNEEEAGNGIAMVPRTAINKDLNAFLAEITISKNIPLTEFLHALEREGATIEEYVTAPIVAFPSVKMEILPDATVRNLATHEQILNNMTYSGSQFPADRSYRVDLIRNGYQIALAARDRGARGIVSIDFLATKAHEDEPWLLWAIEINARKGATTHSNFWSRWLTGATYCQETGELSAVTGNIQYRASEFFKHEKLRDVSPLEICAAVKEAGLDFDMHRQSGVFVHMVSCVRAFSKIGATIIGHNNQEIEASWAALENLLEDLACKRDRPRLDKTEMPVAS